MSKRQKRSVFSNNKVLIIISFILAVVIWFSYSIILAPEKTKTLSNVLVTFDLEGSGPEQLGLKAYGHEDITINVEIFGNSHAVGNATEDDIIATVTTQSLNQVDDAGYKKLQLHVRAANDDIVINSVSKTEIEVYFDYHETREFEIVHNVIEPEGGIAKDGFYYGGAIYGAEELSISGPKAELDKITQVVAETVVTERLSKTTSMAANVSIRTEDEQAPKYISYDDSQAKEVSLSVQRKKSLSPMVKFENIPDGYKNDAGEFSTDEIKLVYSKDEISVAGTESQINSLAYLEIGTVDFKQLSPNNNTFEFELKTPNGTTVIDGTEKVSVTVDMSKFAVAELDLDSANIELKNLPAEYTASVADFTSGIKIVAPKQMIASITSGLVVAEIDFANVSVTAGTLSVELNVGVKNSSDCWACGTYTATVVIN